MNKYDLDGKVVVITGGAGGIGRAIASLLLRSNAKVSLWDVSDEALEAAMRDLASIGGGAVTKHLVDVTDEAAIASAVAADRSSYGRLDALINNAGILGEVKPIWEIDPADMRQVIETNLIGAFLCTRAVLSVMRAQPPQPHRGHIVNLASIQGKEGMAQAAAYSASKAGLMALTKSVAKEVAGEHIFVNCITPAAAETAMAQLITPERRAEIVARIPMGRFVTVEEIAQMVAWLISDECSFSTGAVFDLSGGRATY
jgi:2-dehydro-3-deoxy-L-rhamnonate dehydrogenase (NAD+)